MSHYPPRQTREEVVTEDLDKLRADLSAFRRSNTPIEADIAAVINANRSSLYSSDFDAPPLPSKENQE